MRIETLEAIRRNYDIGNVLQYNCITKGRKNRNVRVSTSTGDYVVRITTNAQVAAGIETETRLLSKIGPMCAPFFQVPRVLHNFHARSYTATSIGVLTVFHHIPGVSLDARRFSHFSDKRKIGTISRNLRRLHRVLEQQDAILLTGMERICDRQHVRIPDEMIRRRLEQLTESEHVAAWLKTYVVQHLGEALEHVSCGDQPYERTEQVIHGDVRFGNMLFTDGQLQGIIDFQDVSRGPVEFDLASFVVHALTCGRFVDDGIETFVQPDAIESFVSGYGETGRWPGNRRLRIGGWMFPVLKLDLEFLFECDSLDTTRRSWLLAERIACILSMKEGGTQSWLRNRV